MERKNEYKGIDIIKLLCSVMVVAIHTEPCSFNIWADRAVGIVTRVAVPFFFTASGFFLCLNKERIENKDVIKSIKRLLILFIINTVIYVPFNIENIYFEIKNNLSVITIFNIIVRMMFEGISPHLWYLPASVLGFILFYIFSKQFDRKSILFISSILFVFGILFSTYYQLLLNIFGNYIYGIESIINLIGTRNGLFYGFFFISLGAFIEENRGRLKIKSYLYMFIFSLFVLGLEALFAVNYLETNSTILWFSQSVAAYTLINIALLIKPNVSEEKCLMFRKLSILIYNFHYLFMIIYSKIIGETGIMLFIAVLFSTILLSMIIIKLSKKYPLLKKLY